MTELAGKTVVITGSTSGMGMGLVRGLAQAGANVVLNGFGGATEVMALITSAIKLHSSVGVLVNNAGNQQVSPVDKFTGDKWKISWRQMGCDH